MQYQIHGIMPLDFTSDDGSAIKGTNLHVSCESDNEALTGRMVDKLFIKQAIALPPLKVGDTIDISFTRKGKVDKVSLASK